MSNKEAVNKYKQKFKEKGLKRKEVYILPEDAEKLKALEEESIKKAVERNQ